MSEKDFNRLHDAIVKSFSTPAELAESLDVDAHDIGHSLHAGRTYPELVAHLSLKRGKAHIRQRIRGLGRVAGRYRLEGEREERKGRETGNGCSDDGSIVPERNVKDHINFQNPETSGRSRCV